MCCYICAYQSNTKVAWCSLASRCEWKLEVSLLMFQHWWQKEITWAGEGTKLNCYQSTFRGHFINWRLIPFLLYSVSVLKLVFILLLFGIVHSVLCSSLKSHINKHKKEMLSTDIISMPNWWSDFGRSLQKCIAVDAVCEKFVYIKRWLYKCQKGEYLYLFVEDLLTQMHCKCSRAVWPSSPCLWL